MVWLPLDSPMDTLQFTVVGDLGQCPDMHLSAKSDRGSQLGWGWVLLCSALTHSQLGKSNIHSYCILGASYTTPEYRDLGIWTVDVLFMSFLVWTGNFFGRFLLTEILTFIFEP